MPAITNAVKAQAIWEFVGYFSSSKEAKGFSARFCVGIAIDIPNPPVVYAIAEPACTSLLAALPLTFGNGVSMVYGRVSNTNKEHAARALVLSSVSPTARSGESPVGDANMEGDGLLWLMQTADRRQAHRPTLGVRDGDIAPYAVFNVGTSGYNNGIGYTRPGSTSGLTASAAYSYYQDVLLKDTYSAHFDDATSLWTVQPWTSINFSKVISRSLGSPFGSRPHVSRIR